MAKQKCPWLLALLFNLDLRLAISVGIPDILIHLYVHVSFVKMVMFNKKMIMERVMRECILYMARLLIHIGSLISIGENNHLLISLRENL